MNKHILKFILPPLLFILIFLTLVPRFTSDFLDLRQKRENEENYQRILREELAKKKAEEDAKEKIYLLGKFDQEKREDFIEVPEEYNIGGYRMYLRKETLDAFERMAELAKKENIELNMTSATRNFDYQKELWNKRWEGILFVDGKNLLKEISDEQERFQKILEYSAAPGTSRHHWGTDIDINGVTQKYFETEEGKKVYDWLVKNAPSFGFCQTYNTRDATRVTGYNEEKWHWSYLPLSRNFTQEYKRLITEKDINGFDGDKYVPTVDLINDYVLAINPDCI